MAKDEKESKGSARRTQVADLPQPEKELTPEEQRQVKGGLGGMRIGMGGVWAGGGSGSTDAGGGSEPQGTPHLIRIIE